MTPAFSKTLTDCLKALPGKWSSEIQLKFLEERPAGLAYHFWNGAMFGFNI
jgi:hypothetical protein